MDYLPICNETGKPQGGHRFVLEQPGEKMLLVVGLNPSNADETHPDLTMHKVMGFAEGGGYDGFAMLNLSSERATDKWSLSATLDEPMHRKNLDDSGHIGRFRKRYFGETLPETMFSGFIRRAAYKSGPMVPNRETHGERKSPPSALCPIRLGISAVQGEKIYDKT